MKKRIVISSAILLAASVALAQESRSSGVSVRGGAFFPVNDMGRTEGNTWFGGGLDYRVADVRMGRMGSTQTAHWALSVDFYNKGDLSAFPIMANYCLHNNELYYFVGAGVSFVRDYTVVGAARSKRNRTTFAYRAGVGYDFQKGSNPLFVEGSFFGNSASALNGIGVYVGIRL